MEHAEEEKDLGENGRERRRYPHEIRIAAKGMYLRRFSVREIAQALNVPRRTVYHWAGEGEWDNLLSHESAEEALSRRLTLLAEREHKGPAELKELDALLCALERLQTLRKKALEGAGPRGGAGEGGEDCGRGTERAGERGTGRAGTKKLKNDVSRLTPELFREKFHSRFFDYQRGLYAAKEHRLREILKARQIGATWYFSQEAFEDAALTGDNQIFLSATKAQSHLFKEYIVNLCGEAFDITLSGNPLVLHTARGPAHLYFLSTSSRSAQGYHGHVYMDEFFWIPRFAEFFKVASAMSAHKKWRRTLFSTPSIIGHEAYPRWSGEEFRRRMKNAPPWPDFDSLREGLICPDRTWRKIITLDDAEAGGCDLFDREALQWEYTPEQFRQLFGCEFIDDTQGVFTLAALEACMQDPAEWGIDFRAARPLGAQGLWAGYDPSRERDDASFVVLAPPVGGGKIRVVERHTWRGKSYLWQVRRIKEIAAKYRLIHLGIDVTGPGQAVYENVRLFCPVATPIVYGLQSKANLVLKGKEVIEQGRLAFDAAEIDIMQALLSIRQVATPTGQITYAAHRTRETGHADVAWAIFHALAAEPLGRRYGAIKRSSVAISA